MSRRQICNDGINKCDTGAADYEKSDENEKSSRIKIEAKRVRKSARIRRIRAWGADFSCPSSPSCPDSIERVAEGAFKAISGTLFGMNKPSPNIVVNAMAKKREDVRPVGFFKRDSGRLGIEIDGAAFLLPSGVDRVGQKSRVVVEGNSYNCNRVTSKQINSRYEKLEGYALRMISFSIAAKLSKRPWDGLEDDVDWGGDDNKNDRSKKNSVYKKKRPIVLYFNTRKQALLASAELRMLRSSRVARYQKQRGRIDCQGLEYSNYKYDNILDGDDEYSEIRILHLGQNDAFPKDIIKAKHMNAGKSVNKGDGERKSRRQIATDGVVYPSNGMIVIVGPSDADLWGGERRDGNDSRYVVPPVPRTVGSMQRLLARSSVEGVPTVVISPRITERTASNKGRGGFDQSRYQMSGTYGGAEPPTETPWILRDLIPPVFSWVGCASVVEGGGNNDDSRNISGAQRSSLSRVALTQTVMESGHPWHVFVTKQEGESDYEIREGNYRCVASTKTSSGRPTKGIIQDIVDHHDEFHSCKSTNKLGRQ